MEKGYGSIALSEFLHNRAEAFYNKKNRTFIFKVDDEIEIGPLTEAQLNAFKHVVEDVLWKIKQS